MYAKLIAKIENRQALIGVIGLGFVGLPLAVEVAKAGFAVVGIDVNEERVAQVNAGNTYIADVDAGELAAVVASGRLRATTERAVLREVDAVSIAVPTPLSKSKNPDVSYIARAMAALKEHFRPGKLIVLESTTYPGTTRELIVNDLEASGFRLDVDFFAAYSPERVDPGNPVYRTRNTPKVIGAASPLSLEVALTLYRNFIETLVPVANCEEAEMCKLMENTFRAVNIGFANEMAMMCDRMGINIWNVIAAATSKPFGYLPFYPGPGIGGHCIPLDPIYLSWRAKHYGFFSRSIELATDINNNMPGFTVDKLLRAMNKHKKILNGAKVILVGVAYKQDVNDLRESPALSVYDLLTGLGAAVQFYDPYIDQFQDRNGNMIRGLPGLTPAILAAADVVVITTAHTSVDYDLIMEHAPLIFDTRNALQGLRSPKVEVL